MPQPDYSSLSIAAQLSGPISSAVTSMELRHAVRQMPTEGRERFEGKVFDCVENACLTCLADWAGVVLPEWLQSRVRTAWEPVKANPKELFTEPEDDSPSANLYMALFCVQQGLREYPTQGRIDQF